ncbi:general secretion pathway protein GspB [Vibrio profundi]|uniref:general secretion pathway protein GspB n=1 Tax=Vibrio profundi TaxID=1774960 RepID=UPI00373601A1
MSQVMKALQRSERESLGYASGSPSVSYGAPAKKRSTIFVAAAIILIPSAVVFASQVYLQSSIVQPVEPKTEVASAVIVETSRPSLIRPAPSFSDLKALPRGNTQLLASLPSESVQEPIVKQEVKESLSSSAPQESSLTPVTQASDNNSELENLDMSEFSPELALTIESILSGSNQISSSGQETIGAHGSALDIEKDSAQLEGWLPKLNFQTHMYSSDETKRWIKVNDQEVSQGEWLKEDVQVVDIEPQFVIIQFKRLNIKVPALYEWQG